VKISWQGRALKTEVNMMGVKMVTLATSVDTIIEYEDGAILPGVFDFTPIQNSKEAEEQIVYCRGW